MSIGWSAASLISGRMGVRIGERRLARLGMGFMLTAFAVGVLAGPRESILVLTGVTKPEDISRYPYIPTHVYDSVAEIQID